MIVAFAIGCALGLGWSAAQTQIEPSSVDQLERDPAAPVDLVLVASDGSSVSDTIDRLSGGGGFSHCYLSLNHVLPDGAELIVDYQPGAGVHYARDDAYRARGRARLRLDAHTGAEVWGCVRARLGQPFDAAGLLVGNSTVATCSGLLWSCLPPAVQRRLAARASGRAIAPNDFAALFGAVAGETVPLEVS